MVRLRGDVEGCGCLRCQDVAIDARRRSLAEVLRWSARLPVAYPSIAVVFLAIGLAQVALIVTPVGDPLLASAVGLFGALVGRGYVAAIGRVALRRRRGTSVSALGRLLRRLPAFLVAVALLAGGLLVFVIVVTAGLAGPIRDGLQAVGFSRLASDGVVLIVLAAGIVYVVTKLWFLPEACFVGGYGPVASLRVSWAVATLHRVKALALVAGFVGLLGLGVLFETHLSDPSSPLALTLTYRETTVVLRSFGFSATGGLRTAFDLLLGLLSPGVFVHHYVDSALERR